MDRMSPVKPTSAHGAVSTTTAKTETRSTTSIDCLMQTASGNTAPRLFLDRLTAATCGHRSKVTVTPASLAFAVGWLRHLKIFPYATATGSVMAADRSCGPGFNHRQQSPQRSAGVYQAHHVLTFDWCNYPVECRREVAAPIHRRVCLPVDGRAVARGRRAGVIHRAA